MASARAAAFLERTHPRDPGPRVLFSPVFPRHPDGDAAGIGEDATMRTNGGRKARALRTLALLAGLASSTAAQAASSGPLAPQIACYNSLIGMPKVSGANFTDGPRVMLPAPEGLYVFTAKGGALTVLPASSYAEPYTYFVEMPGSQFPYMAYSAGEYPAIGMSTAKAGGENYVRANLNYEDTPGMTAILDAELAKRLTSDAGTARAFVSGNGQDDGLGACRAVPGLQKSVAARMKAPAGLSARAPRSARDAALFRRHRAFWYCCSSSRAPGWEMISSGKTTS